MLRVKLRHLTEWIARRQHVAALYDELLCGLPVVTPKVEAGNTHVYYMYNIRAERRDALKDYLIEHGVGCYVVYPYLVPGTDWDLSGARHRARRAAEGCRIPRQDSVPAHVPGTHRRRSP